MTDNYITDEMVEFGARKLAAKRYKFLREYDADSYEFQQYSSEEEYVRDRWLEYRESSEVIVEAIAPMIAERVRHTLPYDVVLPGTTFKKGCELETLINAAGRWKEALMEERVNGWRLIESAPKSKYVTVSALSRLNKRRTIQAYYIEKFTHEYWGDDDDGYDCDEVTGAGYLREGWYEVRWTDDEYHWWRIGSDLTLTHWMPLPQPPKQETDDDS